MPLLRMSLAAIACSLAFVSEGMAQTGCSESSLAKAIAEMPEFIPAKELTVILEGVASVAGCDPRNLMTSAPPPSNTQTASAGPKSPEVWILVVENVAQNAVPALTDLQLHQEFKGLTGLSNDRSIQIAALRPTGRVEITFSSKPAGAQVEYAGIVKGSTDMQVLLSESALNAVRLLLDGYQPCDRHHALYHAGRFHCDMQANQ